MRAAARGCSRHPPSSSTRPVSSRGARGGRGCSRLLPLPADSSRGARNALLPAAPATRPRAAHGPIRVGVRGAGAAAPAIRPRAAHGPIVVEVRGAGAAAPSCFRQPPSGSTRTDSIRGAVSGLLSAARATRTRATHGPFRVGVRGEGAVDLGCPLLPIAPATRPLAAHGPVSFGFLVGLAERLRRRPLSARGFESPLVFFHWDTLGLLPAAAGCPRLQGTRGVNGAGAVCDSAENEAPLRGLC